MKNYKKYQLIFSISIIFLLLIFIFTYFLFNYTYHDYSKIDGVFILDNVIEIFVSTSDLKTLEKNKQVYINSKRKNVEIITINKNIFKKNNKNYHEVLIRIKNIDKNASLNIAIRKNNKKLISLFVDCIKEE